MSEAETKDINYVKDMVDSLSQGDNIGAEKAFKDSTSLLSKTIKKLEKSILKSSINNCTPSKLLFGSIGYLIALFKQKPFIVTKEEGYFIRKFRWSVIRKKYLEF